MHNIVRFITILLSIVNEIFAQSLTEKKHLLLPKEKYFILQVDNKKGILDCIGNEILPVKYDDILFEKNDKPGIALLEKKYFNIELNGKITQNTLLDYDNNKITTTYFVTSGPIRRKQPTNHTYVSNSQLIGYLRLIHKNGKSFFYKDTNLVVQYKRAYSLDNYRAIVSDGNKYGIFNALTLKQITPLKYDYIRSLYTSQKLMVAKINNKCGLLDFDTGEEITAFIYDSISYNNCCWNSSSFISALKNNKWGVISNKGIEITGFKYNNASMDRSEVDAVLKNYLAVKIGNTKALFDSLGKMVIVYGKYENIFSYHNDSTIYFTRKGKPHPNYINEGKVTGIFTKDFKEKTDTYSKLPSLLKNESFQRNICCEYNIRYNFLELDINKDFFNHRNLPQFNMVNANNANKGYVLCTNDYDAYSKNQKYFYYYKIDTAISKVIATYKLKNAPWYEISKPNTNSIASNNEKYGIIDKDGEEIVPIAYDEISELYLSTQNFNQDTTTVLHYLVKQNGKFGVLSKLGKIIVPIEYQKIEVLKNIQDRQTYFYKAKKEGKWYVLDFNGNLVSKNTYDDVAYSWNSTIIRVKIQNKNAYIDSNGSYLIPPEYDWLGEPNITKHTLFKKDKKYGLLDLKNNIVIENKYDYLEIWDDEACIIKQNGKKGLLSIKNEKTITTTFDEIYTNQYHGIAVVKVGKKYGLINNKGVELTSINYDYYTQNEFYIHLTSNNKSTCTLTKLFNQ